MTTIVSRLFISRYYLTRTDIPVPYCLIHFKCVRLLCNGNAGLTSTRVVLKFSSRFESSVVIGNDYQIKLYITYTHLTDIDGIKRSSTNYWLCFR